MRFRDIFESEKCISLFKDVNSFTTILLKEYNDSIDPDTSNSGSKDIFDFVWGSVDLSSVEISLLDSPLLQRLRNIKQLGFGHFVYCNADYSRFAHTIGVIEISGRMAEVVKNRLLQEPSKDDEQIYDMREIVRLAAIFHDCGHMFFSHVAESFFTQNSRYKKYSIITDALTYFNQMISSRAAFHEMIGVMIVNSDEVFRFFSLVEKHFSGTRIKNENDRKLLIDYISGLIVGTAIDKNILPYSSIIKGAIDADRMDYLSRDSSTTKVPLAVDIGRLIKKITVVKLDEYHPSEVWVDLSEGDRLYQSMAIKYSAQRLIWQLSMARAIMYQSVYFHHKKLTAEAMLKRACEKIFSINPEYGFDKLLLLTDQVFNDNFSKILIPQELEGSEACIEAQEIIKRIMQRNLYKRVASFSQDVFGSEDICNENYELFVCNIIENPFSDEFKNFVDSLNEEYYKALDSINEHRPADTPIFMFIDANWKNEMSGDIPIDYGNAPYKMSSQIYKEAPTFGEANRQKYYYLVTDQKNRKLVYAALEKVLFTKYDLRLSESASTCAKFNLAQLNETKKTLFEKNYYDESLSLLPDQIMQTLYSQARFRRIIEKYHAYNGVDGSKVNEASLKKFLRQFLRVECKPEEIKMILNGVLLLLEHAIFIDRPFFSTNVEKLMRKIRKKGYQKNYLVKLGGAFDSANRLTYYFNDIKDKEGYTFIESIAAALEVTDNYSDIVLFDDGAYSGKQVISIFQELMGIPQEKRETNETHTVELSEENKKRIKSAKIILAYICFNKASEKTILCKLGELGIANVEIVFEHDMSHKVFDASNQFFTNQEQRELLKNVLDEIGYSVQKNAKAGKNGEEYKKNWNEERVKNSSLGYNNSEPLMILDFNVPTYTITAFWQNGEYKNMPWRGLFQRTEKDPIWLAGSNKMDEKAE